jgi:hypothetical protein
MADRQRSSSSNRRSENGSESSGRSSGRRGQSRGRSRNGLSAREAVQRVREDFPALLGRRIEEVLGVQRDDEDGWHIMVQIVELARIPNSSDVLGAYLVTLDDEGEIQGWQRQRRYIRSQPDED